MVLVRRKSQKFFLRQDIATKSEFLNQVKRQDAEQKIKSGIYVITTGTKPADIVHLLISGPNAPGSGFVVPEGYTVSQVADLVQDYFGISRDDFLNQAKHPIMLLTIRSLLVR